MTPTSGGPARAVEPATPIEQDLARRYADVFTILGAPRTCSTLLARVLWASPAVDFYCHEPFDGVYHRGWGLDDVRHKLSDPVDVRSASRPHGARPTLLVKELSFQVGPWLPVLVRATTRPIVFTIRDPRLSISSRMRMRARGGEPPLFPVVESGWGALAAAVDHCRRHDVPYAIVDASDLRRSPATVVDRVFDVIGVRFDERALRWDAAGDVDLRLSLDSQRHWNDRVLKSVTIEPPVEPVPDVASFPDEGGMRAHVVASLELYAGLRGDANLVRP